MTMPKLSEASEQRISSALAKVAELTNDGETPNDAITKIATELKIPAGHVRLMVRAYNNGLTLGHLKNHDSLEEKAAAFPLADAACILEKMYPAEVKTKAAEKHASAVSNEYVLPPDSWLKRRDRCVEPMQKAASDKTASPYPELPERAGRLAVSQLNDMRRAVDQLNTATVGAAYGVIDAIEKIAAYFRDPHAYNFAEVEHNAETVYGQRVSKLMAKVATDKTVLKRFQKEAAVAGSKHPLTHAVNWDAAPYRLIKEALGAVDTFSAKRAELTTLQAEVAEKKAGLLRPFVQESQRHVITGSVWDARSQTKQAEAGPLAFTTAGLTGNMATNLAERMMPDSKEKMVQDRMNDLSTPKHEDKLRKIRTQAMIHEFMAADPIISGYNAEEVLSAYNHLSETAPAAMQQRVMAQALLRKYLEQSSSMDPFDIQQMMDADKGIRERDMPTALVGGYRPGPQRELGEPRPTVQVKALETKKPGFDTVGSLDERFSGAGDSFGKAKDEALNWSTKKPETA